MTNKPSKVLIIGSGPIIIGQACCHSEGAERLKNLLGETLRAAQGDNRMMRVTDSNICWELAGRNDG